MLLSSGFAWAWMFPHEIKDTSQSLIAVTIFMSNIYFWLTSGYFDRDAEENPLLHTWTLSVEEQFYLLFPIFLVFVWRFGRSRVFWIIVVCAIMSLALSEFVWRRRLMANFYLAPTRAWELLAGAIAYFILAKKGVISSNLLSLMGLAAVLFSFFFYSSSTPFPSIYTIVPVLGTFIVIIFSGKIQLPLNLLAQNY